MLFHPDRHEPLATTPWDDAQVRQHVQDLVDDLEAQVLPGGPWPRHPMDDADSDTAAERKSLYLGSAGLWWTLWLLQRHGAARLRSDPVEGLRRADADYRRDPDDGRAVPSYQLGESGIALLRWMAAPDPSVGDRLFEVVAGNIGNPTREQLWGAPGTMLAAWHLWSATGEDRWRELFLRNVDEVWRTWDFDAAAGCHLWLQDLHGKQVQYIGAGHGFAGNALPLLKGAPLLDDERRQALYERCVHTLRALATVDGDATNWRPGTYTPRPDGPKMLMQWCHGAPGIVTALADFPVGPYAEMDAMLVAAGQAIWRAGPLAKGQGLCHGTAGNGEAFLVLYRRTGDAMWLDRARAFALHALGQTRRQRQQHGQGRYTLWTGDAGVALFLWQCLDGRAGMPSLDFVQ